MAEVARQAEVGTATLYRNFPTRHDLLEALLFNEIDELSLTAMTDADNADDTAADRLERWLRHLFRYVTEDRPIALNLLAAETPNQTALIKRTRERMSATAQAQLQAAQEQHQYRADVDLDQVLDFIMAIAKIPGDPIRRAPLIDAALHGLRESANGGTP